MRIFVVSRPLARAVAGSLSLIVCSCLGVAARAGEKINFNPDWRFVKTDEKGAWAADFNDKSWKPVSAPHTYNDEDTFDDWSEPGHRGETMQWSGRTWYRKSFTLPDSYKGKKVFIEFEGVRQVADVYLNGKLLGTSKTGFVPFGFDLTPHLVFGRPNVIAVMCDNRFMEDPLPSQRPDAKKEKGEKTEKNEKSDKGLPPPPKPTNNPNLSKLHTEINATLPEESEKLTAEFIPWNNPHWHPAHGGIYRNVFLHVTDPLHITLPLYSFLKTVGPYAYASEITTESARLNFEIPVRNDRKSGEDVEVQVEVFDQDGKSVLSMNETESIAAGSRNEYKLSGRLKNPRLWEPAYPYLYRAVCTVRAQGVNIVDTHEFPLGIRTVRWDAQHGFFINGRHLKLQGWGQKPTNEWAGLGAAQPDWLHHYTMVLMKDAGGNFVRWGHTPAGPSLIASSDRLGLITLQPGVDGEHDTVGAAWRLRAEAFRDLIIYFRNNPSILIWEGGNQKVSREHAAELRGYMDKYDPHGGRAYAHRRADQVTAEFMDVGIGTQGGREIPDLPVVEGEYNREESPRRVWDNFSPPNFGYHEAKGQTYHLTSEEFAANQVSQYVRMLGPNEHSGGANWIFSDSTSGGRVSVEVARASGEVDGVRLPKEAYYACQVVFRDEPGVHIIGHWSYPTETIENGSRRPHPDTIKPVYVVSNAEEVELFVNGKSIGRQGPTADRYLFLFDKVKWEAGEVKAVAYSGGREVAQQVKQTAGAPVALRLTTITGPAGLLADGSDVVLIDVEAVDDKGRRCPTVQQRVDFQMEGPGIWRGGYNSGKPKSINHPYLDIEAGVNRVAVRATRTPGKITVKATSANLKPASITVEAKPFAVTDGVAKSLPALPATPLPATAPEWVLTGSSTEDNRARRQRVAQITPLIKTFSYSGPTTIVHIEQKAKNGKNVYVDREFAFTDLPSSLEGADWVQAAESDALYSAVDLMEMAVKGPSVVSVAHDDRLPRPAWLLRDFRQTPQIMKLPGHTLTIFQRDIPKDESITFGPNTEDNSAKAAHMYVVFISEKK